MTALLTKKELAFLLSVSPRTVDRLCSTGAFPFTLVGDRRRFNPVDIEKYLAGRTFQHHQRG